MRFKFPFILLFGILFACSEIDSTHPESDLPIIQSGQVYEFRNGDDFGLLQFGVADTLRMEILEINDSRCPEDVICIWAGNASVKIRARLHSDIKELELCIGACPGVPFQESDTLQFKLENHSYTAILKDVIPYPNTNNNSEEKKVILEIRN